MVCYDVIVIGAGSSGMTAAIAAAREGASVLLIEKSGILGGTNTGAMVCPLMTFHANHQQIIAGLAQDIVDRLELYHGTLGHVPDPLGVTETITPIEPTQLKQVYFAMLKEYPNIRLLLHTALADTVVNNDSVASIRCLEKSGMTAYGAKVYIDASGDGDLAAMAGADYSQGRKDDGLAQPMSMLFKIGNIDFGEIRSYIKKYPEQFILRENAMDQDYTAVSGFFDLVAQARKNGDLNLERDRVLLFQGVKPDEAIVNMTRVIKKRGTFSNELTDAEIEVHRQIDEIMTFLRSYIPGCAGAELIETGSGIGVRESRRIKGHYTLTTEDIMRNSVFPDSIACCGFPIDIHDPLGAGLNWHGSSTNHYYDVPYRIMLPSKLENVITTGRCVSATHEAMASLRITATAMAMGEAAGIAAALSVQQNMLPKELDVSMLQNRIINHGGIPGRFYLEQK